MTLCLSDVLYMYTYSMCRCSSHPFQCGEGSEGGGRGGGVSHMKMHWLSGSSYLNQSKMRSGATSQMRWSRRDEAISYWINTDPLASWRRLIRALDRMRETKVADSIRSNAEPLTGIVTMYYYCMFSCATTHTVHYASHYTMYTA